MKQAILGEKKSVKLQKKSYEFFLVLEGGGRKKTRKLFEYGRKTDRQPRQRLQQGQSTNTAATATRQTGQLPHRSSRWFLEICGCSFHWKRTQRWRNEFIAQWKGTFFFSLDHALCLRIPKKPPVSLEHPSGDRGHETERHSEAHPGQQTQGHSSPLEKRVEAVVQQRNQHDEEQHVEQRQPSCRYLSQRNKTWRQFIDKVTWQEDNKKEKCLTWKLEVNVTIAAVNLFTSPPKSSRKCRPCAWNVVSICQQQKNDFNWAKNFL